MWYHTDDRHQMNLVFGRAPLGHVTTTVSFPRNNLGSFKLLQAKESWTKSNKAGCTDGQLQFSSICQPNNSSTLNHDLDRLLSFKGTAAEVLNQGSAFYVLQLYAEKRKCLFYAIFNLFSQLLHVL